MTRTRWHAAVASATIFILGQLVLAAPVGATSATATVTADMPGAAPAGRLWTFNDFFPRTVTVRTGTDLQFINQGFHTFTVLPAGATPRPDWRTNGVGKDDTDDSTLNPNGTTRSEFNVPALSPTSFTCGSAAAPCAFDGSSTVSSGAPLGGPPGPFVVHVSAAPGLYFFVCRVHAGMSGKLNVVGADAPVPSSASVDASIAKQVKHDLAGAWIADRKANRDAITQNRDGSRTLHVTAGISSPDGRVALLEYFPRNLDAKPGDKVVFTPKSPNEPHTVTFPGDLGTEMLAYCEAGSVDVPFGPPSFCNGGPPDEIEFGGGNGVSLVTAPGPTGTVSDSGIIGPHKLTQQNGTRSTDILNTWTISLAGAAPGTYTYVCQIHDGMHSTITVH